jgi:PST family polysaccharide transporter
MRSLSQFVIGVLLARLLGPEPFGIVAVAWLILSVGNLFADLGFGAALVQGKTVSALQLRFAFTCQMVISLLMMGAGIGMAEYIAAYFHKPQASPVICAMFVLFPLQAVGQTGAAMLRRSLHFKTLQTIAIVSYLAGYLVVGIPAAYFGLGVWSLVIAQLLQSALNSALLLAATAVPVKPYFHRGSDKFVSFGLQVMAANLSSWSISNLDTLCIGRAFSVVDLGLYSRAANLLITPMSIISTGFQGVLFAASSRAQSDREKVRHIYLETTAAVALLCFPIFFTAALIPATLIDGIYGKKWDASVPVVLPLALAVAINALLAIEGPLLMAAGRVGLELKNQFFTILFFIPLLWLATYEAMAAVAWVVFIAYLGRWILLTADTLRITGASAADYAAVFPVPLLCGACVGAAAAITDHLLFFLPALSRLLAIGAVCCATSLLLAHCLGRYVLTNMLGTLVDVKDLPGKVSRLLKIEVAA